MSLAIGILAIIGIAVGALYLIEHHSGELGENLRSYKSIGALMVIIFFRCAYSAYGSFDQFPTWFALALIGIAIVFPFAAPIGTDEVGFKIFIGSEIMFLSFSWLAGVAQNGFITATIGLGLILLFQYVQEARQLFAKLL